MCNASGIIFGATVLNRNEIEGKRIIEIGSLDVNGSLRPIIMLGNPAEYIGIDIEKGQGVDFVFKAEDVVEKFGRESFDIVISTELIEHVKDWRKVISNIKNICKTNGAILITTRSYGFAYHSYPYDFWRYEIEDMKNIFSDCIIEKLEKDELEPGVFVKVKKPRNFMEKDLSHYELYSIIIGKKARDIKENRIKEFQRKYKQTQYLKEKVYKIERILFKIGKFIQHKIF